MSLLAERSSRSAWNARAAVVRCSGARVLRTPSHVKASLTAAMVVRSLLAALGVVCVTGLLVGWVAVRRELVWPVSWDVVVAVDIGTWNLLGECVEDPAATTADRLVAARAWKSPWLVTVLEAYGGRLAIEPPATERGQVGAKSAGERGMAPLNQRLAVAGETPSEAVISGHFNSVGPVI